METCHGIESSPLGLQFFLNLIKWEGEAVFWGKFHIGGDLMKKFFPLEKVHARPIFPVLKGIIVSRVHLIVGGKTMQRECVLQHQSS